jgi:uncharacterized protein YndB with AHSA1/START domain
VVFQFLTNQEKMIRWMGIKVEIDPRPGGVYRVEPNGKDIIRGKYIEIVPDSRVVFTWGYENPSPGLAAVHAGSTQVEIDLIAEGQGTRLRLTHRQLPPAATEPHEMGWMHYLERLKFIAGPESAVRQ